jgi:leader peptidase (prepilin peptidase)/N-methyltransferase
VTASTVLGALFGLAWGLAADRLAARWPAHDDGAIRRIDWRTPAVAIVGALAVALFAARYVDGDGSTALAERALMIVVTSGLVVLLATDLDQRLLPDVLTLPLVALALGAFALGVNPYVGGPGELAVAVGAAIVLPLGMFLLSLPFGQGAIGLGDLKLLVGVGLLGGAARLLAAVVAGAILAAVAIVILLGARRITLRSYVPYGPFLVLGALWALLVLPATWPG